MKHGIKQRKLGRMPAHRIALLRNLVSALLHHESIKTTLPKAKEAARMAEKVITLGKKGTEQSRSAAMAYLMPSHHYSPSAYTATPPAIPPLDYPSSSSSRSVASTSASSRSRSLEGDGAFDIESELEEFKPPTTLLPKVFTTLASRYANRPGGYTRIHKFGRRQGDNAPHAILSLVDGPRDLKFELLARTVGKEGLDILLDKGGLENVTEDWTGLRDETRKNVEKVLRYRSKEEQEVFKAKAKEFADHIQAEESAYNGLKAPHISADRPEFRPPGINTPKRGKALNAGERLSGVSVAHTGLGLARGQLGRRPRSWESPDRTPRFWNTPVLPDTVGSEGDRVVQRDSAEALNA